MTSWQQELGDLGENFRKNSNDDLNNFQSPEETKLDILRICAKQKNQLKKNCAAKRLDTFAILISSFFNERNCNGTNFGVVILDFIDVRL